MSSTHSDFYDLERLFSFRQILEQFDPGSFPRALCVDPGQRPNPDRVGILPGSFNPPTHAHVELTLQAKKTFKLDHVFFMISRLTVDKEKIEGLCLEDRLLILSLLARELGSVSVAVTNRGLYFEQAKALRALLGRKAKMFFLVGMDKLIQILDPRYYEDRESALVALFTEAQLVAASRGSLKEERFQEILGSQENENCKDRMYFLSLAEENAMISSSVLRANIQRGDPSKSWVPEIVAAFISETGAYGDFYEFRLRLLNFLYGIRDKQSELVDFRKLVATASERTEKGEKLRSLLSSSHTSSLDLKDFLAS